MLGVKLRSERIDLYDVLGERGQPVYLAAAQILTALARHNPDLARHFAVPQPSDDSSRIDWYAPSNGAVVPWASATDAEKAAATAQLTTLQTEINRLRASLQAKSGSSQNSLFSQLLPWVLHHPDPSHIYIIDGVPVLTFWGFLSAGADRNIAPFHALSPVSTPQPLIPAASAVSLAASQAIAAPAVITTAIPWWRHWWWWLLLLPLLALLFFGIRACSLPPVLPVALAPAIAPDYQEEQVPRTAAVLPSLDDGSSTADSHTATGDVDTAAVSVLPAAGADAAPVSESTALVPPADAPTPELSPATGTPLPQAHAAPAGTVQPSAALSPAAPSRESDLTLPPDLPEGQAAFLNGDWLVRSGIQDKATGQPLRLQYTFENGQGQVALKRSNGTLCHAPVSAALANGTLAITNDAQATCNDGSTYEMPVIRCQPDETHVASCDGSYGDILVPLTMRQARP